MPRQSQQSRSPQPRRRQRAAKQQFQKSVSKRWSQYDDWEKVRKLVHQLEFLYKEAYAVHEVPFGAASFHKVQFGTSGPSAKDITHQAIADIKQAYGRRNPNVKDRYHYSYVGFNPPKKRITTVKNLIKYAKYVKKVIERYIPSSQRHLLKGRRQQDIKGSPQQ